MNRLKEWRDMMYFKACPRCKGDLYTNRDVYGEYKECLQCGYMEEIARDKAYPRVHVSCGDLFQEDKDVA